MSARGVIGSCLAALPLWVLVGVLVPAPAAAGEDAPGLFPSRSQYPYVELVFAPDELAPGPAKARVDSRRLDAFEHRVRFNVEAGKASVVHLFVSGYWGEEMPVVVQDAGGRTHRRRHLMQHNGRAGNGRIFMGQAAELTILTSLVKEAKSNIRRKEGESQSLNTEILAGLQLHEPSALTTLGCDALAQSELVITTGDPAALLTCVSQGVRVLAIGGVAANHCFDLAEAAAAPASRAAATPAPSTGACPAPTRQAFGLGALVWAADLPAAAAYIADRARAYGPVVEDPHSWMSNPHDYAWEREDPFSEEHRGQTPAWIALAVIIGFIGTAVVTGIVVARQPRRPFVSWLWFPTLSALTALLILVGSQLLWTGDDKAQITETTIVSPTGAGHRFHGVTIDAWRARSFEVDLPWARAVPVFAERHHRFGSPFAQARGRLSLDEDRIRARMHVGDFSITRLGRASLQWTAPVEPSGAWRLHAQRKEEGIAVTNHTGEPLHQVWLCDHETRYYAPMIAVGASRVMRPSSHGKGPAQALLATCGALQGEGFALLADRKSNPDNIKLEPSIATNTTARLLVVGVLQTTPPDTTQGEAP